MQVIRITVDADRCAHAPRGAAIICDNSDQKIEFSIDPQSGFDRESPINAIFVTARGALPPIVFAGEQVTAPSFSHNDGIFAFVGLSQGSIKTTTPASIMLIRSIYSEAMDREAAEESDGSNLPVLPHINLEDLIEFTNITAGQLALASLQTIYEAFRVKHHMTYPFADIPVYDPENPESTTITLDELADRIAGFVPAIRAKLDADGGNANNVTAQRTLTYPFRDIPAYDPENPEDTAVTLQQLLGILGGWYLAIQNKLDPDGNVNTAVASRSGTYALADIPYSSDPEHPVEISMQELLNRLSAWFKAIVGDIQTISDDGSVSVEMSAYKTYWLTGNLSGITLSFDAFDPALRLGDADHLYTIKYVAGSTAPTVTLPANVAVAAGYTDAVSKTGTVVEISIARIPSIEINNITCDYLATATYAEVSA